MSFLGGFEVGGPSWGDIMEEDDVGAIAAKTMAHDLRTLADDSRDGLNLLFKQTMSTVRDDAPKGFTDAKTKNVSDMN